MTKREMERRTMMNDALMSLGFTRDECDKLRRISMTLRRWHELECGIDGGCIEHHETTDKPYWLDSNTMRRYPIADRESGAKKRLLNIINARAARVGICDVNAFIQTDPRGAALYILRPGDIPQGADVHSYYTRGICVY